MSYMDLDKQKVLKWITVAYVVSMSIHLRYVPSMIFNPIYGIDKCFVYLSTIALFFMVAFRVSLAFFLGLLCLLIQFFVAKFHPESFRASTLIYSAILMISYMSVYTFINSYRVFTIEFFIKLMKVMITTFFVVCILQQICLIIGLTNVPWINLSYLNRGLGCQSLSYEPSSFARFMFVFYFAYITCSGYVEGQKLSFSRIFQVPHRNVTLMFLWMIITMGSGTAYVCLAVLSIVFITRKNWLYILPSIFVMVFVIVPALDMEQSNRAVKILEASTTFDQQTIEEADGSGASRISPLINSFSADFSDPDTWLGKGTDYATNHRLVVLQKGTLFDDYGLIWYLCTLVFMIYTAYKINTYTIILIFSGLAGGSCGNINYSWCLMFIFVCIKYFHDNRFLICKQE